MTHLVGKAAADALRRHPDANVVLRWNRLYLRERVSVCVRVVQPEHHGRVDLTTATVHDADRLALPAFASAMEEVVERVRAPGHPHRAGQAPLLARARAGDERGYFLSGTR